MDFTTQDKVPLLVEQPQTLYPVLPAVDQQPPITTMPPSAVDSAPTTTTPAATGSRAVSLGEQLGSAVATGVNKVIEFDNNHKIHETAVNVAKKGAEKVVALDERFHVHQNIGQAIKSTVDFTFAAITSCLVSINQHYDKVNNVQQQATAPAPVQMAPQQLL